MKSSDNLKKTHTRKNNYYDPKEITNKQMVLDWQTEKASLLKKISELENTIKQLKKENSELKNQINLQNQEDKKFCQSLRGTSNYLNTTPNNNLLLSSNEINPLTLTFGEKFSKNVVHKRVISEMLTKKKKTKQNSDDITKPDALKRILREKPNSFGGGCPGQLLENKILNNIIKEFKKDLNKIQERTIYQNKLKIKASGLTVKKTNNNNNNNLQKNNNSNNNNNYGFYSSQNTIGNFNTNSNNNNNNYNINNYNTFNNSNRIKNINIFNNNLNTENTKTKNNLVTFNTKSNFNNELNLDNLKLDLIEKDENSSISNSNNNNNTQETILCKPQDFSISNSSFSSKNKNLNTSNNNLSNNNNNNNNNHNNSNDLSSSININNSISINFDNSIGNVKMKKNRNKTKNQENSINNVNSSNTNNNNTNKSNTTNTYKDDSSRSSIIFQPNFKSSSPANSSNSSSSKYLYNPIAVLKYHLDTVRNIYIEPNHKILTSISEDSCLCFWDLEKAIKHYKDNPEPFITFRIHTTPIFTLTGPKKSMNQPINVYSSGIDGVIRAVQIPDLKFPNNDECMNQCTKLSWRAHQDMIWQLNYHHNLSLMASVSSDGSVKIFKCYEMNNSVSQTVKSKHFYSYDSSSKNLVRNFIFRNRYYNFVEMPTACSWDENDDNTLYVSHIANYIKVYDINTGQSKGEISYNVDRNIPYESQQANCILYHSNNNLIITGHEDRQIRIFDIRSQELIQNFVAHADSISCLCNGINEFELLTASHDGTVRNWDLRIGNHKLLFDIPAHRKKYDEGCLSLNVIKSDNLMITSGADGIIKIFKI